MMFRTLVLFPLVVSLLCTAPAREKQPGDPQAVPAVHETIWLAPLVDRSGMAKLIALPEDTVERTILSRHFEAMHHKLLTEFRRCEKLGLYRMVNDSLQATMRVIVSLEQGMLTSDTLFIPLAVHVHEPAANRRWNFNWTVAAPTPPAARKDHPFHHAGLQIADLSNAFPYRQIVYPFYR
ncbi:MAG: hypothetical protein JXA71_06595 [Chitinispirillaceae bacterium]|nr:hypothetical protein [Chitinispirillaceae bacterium]